MVFIWHFIAISFHHFIGNQLQSILQRCPHFLLSNIIYSGTASKSSVKANTMIGFDLEPSTDIFDIFPVLVTIEAVPKLQFLWISNLAQICFIHS